MKIRIETANDAFAGKLGYHELARILHDFAGYIGTGSWIHEAALLRDYNGNTVGTVNFCLPSQIEKRIVYLRSDEKNDYFQCNQCEAVIVHLRGSEMSAKDVTCIDCDT